MSVEYVVIAGPPAQTIEAGVSRGIVIATQAIVATVVRGGGGGGGGDHPTTE